LTRFFKPQLPCAPLGASALTLALAAVTHTR
jgi:hypothetical protein